MTIFLKQLEYNSKPLLNHVYPPKVIKSLSLIIIILVNLLKVFW